MRAAGAGDVGVIVVKDQKVYFNCGCVLRVRADNKLAFRSVRKSGRLYIN